MPNPLEMFSMLREGATTAAENLPNRQQALYSIGRTLGRGASHLPTAAGFLQGYVPIAAIGQAALDYGTSRGAQMDQDPVVKQQMSAIRLATQNGWVPTDDGNFLNLNTNELSSYDQLIPTLKTQQSQAKEQEVASSSTLPASAYVETVEEPEATVTTESLTPTQNSIATASKTSPVNKTLSGSGSKKKDDAPKTENQISGLNALIPLLALGGLGYYLARR